MMLGNLAPGPDLDDEARGLCIRGYGDGSQSFIFVYRIGDRQPPPTAPPSEN